MSYPIRPTDQAQPAAAASSSSSTSAPAAFASIESVSKKSRDRFTQRDDTMELEENLEHLSISENPIDPSAVLTHLTTLPLDQKEPKLIFQTLTRQKELLEKMTPAQLQTFFTLMGPAAKKGAWPSLTSEQFILLSVL